MRNNFSLFSFWLEKACLLKIYWDNWTEFSTTLISALPNISIVVWLSKFQYSFWVSMTNTKKHQKDTVNRRLYLRSRYILIFNCQFYFSFTFPEIGGHSNVWQSFETCSQTRQQKINYLSHFQVIVFFYSLYHLFYLASPNFRWFGQRRLLD